MPTNTKIRAVFKWLLSTVSSSLDRFKSAYLPQKWQNKKKNK